MKIHLKDIQKQLKEIGWEVISIEYKNLDTEMTFKCPEGHTVFSSWKKLRNNIECPICKQNKYKEQKNEIIKKDKNKTRILALDQATRISGWSVYDNKELVRYGIFNTSLESEEERIEMVKMWLISMVDSWNPDFVALEDIQLQQLGGKQIVNSDNVVGVKTFKVLAHLQGVLINTLIELKIPYILCPTNTWRNHCKVKGRTKTDKKKSMQIIVKKTFDISVTNDESDAIGIGKYAADTSDNNDIMENWE
jgi:Holliday junction resolvasome RuvABC endonuclease subunit